MLMLQFISGRWISFWNLFIYVVNNSQYTKLYISLVLCVDYPLHTDAFNELIENLKEKKYNME
jgi:hypothetical protein